MNNFRSIEWKESSLLLLDQKKLPHSCEYISHSSYKQVSKSITDMTVRGAPAIGIAAAYGVCLASIEYAHLSFPNRIASIKEAISELRMSRPTAVNLFWALNRMEAILNSASSESSLNLTDQLLSEANKIFKEDRETNISIGKFGSSLLPQNSNVIHHCNTGSLATAEYGTALGIIRVAHEEGKKIHVFVDETRPRLQGGSLTTFELQSLGIPHTLIVDSAAAFVMKRHKIDACFVGCDRVAANGDVANKIGTYSLAIAAKAHGVPFYVACPVSSIDLNTKTGDEIEIEERNISEITEINGVRVSPHGTKAYNPAFDITPSDLITGIITEKGIFKGGVGLLNSVTMA